MVASCQSKTFTLQIQIDGPAQYHIPEPIFGIVASLLLACCRSKLETSLKQAGNNLETRVFTCYQRVASLKRVFTCFQILSSLFRGNNSATTRKQISGK